MPDRPSRGTAVEWETVGLQLVHPGVAARVQALQAVGTAQGQVLEESKHVMSCWGHGPQPMTPRLTETCSTGPLSESLKRRTTSQPKLSRRSKQTDDCGQQW